MNKNDLIKALSIKKDLDNGKITSKQANKILNNELIILGGLNKINN